MLQYIFLAILVYSVHYSRRVCLFNIWVFINAICTTSCSCLLKGVPQNLSYGSTWQNYILMMITIELNYELLES